MKKEVITVPKDKCPLDVLAEMGEQIRNSWIYLHSNVYEKLRTICHSYGTYNRMNDPESALFKWHATKDYPETVVFCDVPKGTHWARIQSIKASDIAYDMLPHDPESLFFLKMDE